MTRSMRVLIVDDEAGLRRYVDRVLRNAGYTTMAAGDGPDALKLFNERGPFDLVIIDLIMPGMRGDELARRLRAKEPDLKVLYFTGYSDQLFDEKITLGAHEAFLDKPVSGKGLLEAVSLLLVGHT
jgi:two-component system cell cycle sensor histidine kinase/response regulator CckA